MKTLNTFQLKTVLQKNFKHSFKNPNACTKVPHKRCNTIFAKLKIETCARGERKCRRATRCAADRRR